MFGGSERLYQSIAFGIDDDIGEGEAGQRICRLETLHGMQDWRSDPAVAGLGERDHGAVGEHRAERSRIDPRGVRREGSFAVARHGNSL